MSSNELKNHLKIAEGFQYSVNISFDLHNAGKIKDFIPTTASLEIIEDIMLSTFDNSTDRARVLIGAYGKGKSHIILVLLSMLFRKEITLFNRLLIQIKEYNPKFYNYAIEYIQGKNKLLPVIIQSNTISLTQAFLGAIQKALEDEGLEDLMPETHFQAAIDRIRDWHDKYKDTYEKFALMLNEPVPEFISKLSDFNVEAYDKFVELFPSLTSGSLFNPFLGFDVIELYSKVIEKLQSRGYHGVFVVYDEFSKFLEAGITKISSVDIKLLQDFAEKCNRSNDKQMHLLLISHKDISNYIDKLPKQKVDGWKGVSERFKHIAVRNNYSQIYEIIATIIDQDDNYFLGFFETYDDKFEDMKQSLTQTNLFSELSDEQIQMVVKDCYPLHPISTFILPRLSEKVAQNERTLFTFLSSRNKNTLSTFIEQANNSLPLLTPDYIYDYFEPLFKREVYTSEIHKFFILTTNILNKLQPDSLGCKIIKTLALIYITEQFDKLPPTPDIIIDTYRETVNHISEITETLRDLQDRQYVIYLKKSNNYLKLKNSIGIDVGAKIADIIEKNKAIYRVKDILNNASVENYLYPTSYNDDNEITRYFDFTFIDSDEFLSVENWDKKLENVSATGVVYGIIARDAEELKKVSDVLSSGQPIHERVVFVLPQNDYDIEKIAFEYQAVKSLTAQVDPQDEALIEEYNIYLEDLEEVIEQFVSAYIKPETRQSLYYYVGQKQTIFRKAQISQLLSRICAEIYTITPLINNEAINKDYLPSIAINSRAKVITGLLNTQLDPWLGLSGSGQEISILRSTLIMTGLLIDITTKPKLVISGNPNTNMQKVLDEITHFFNESSHNQPISFGVLYDRLIKPEYHIGLKKGVIPIYIAAVLHSFKQYVVITRGNRELEINAELLNSINENPSEYSLCLEDWNETKSQYIKGLEKLFAIHILEKEKEYNTFAYVVRAMQRWFISLPRYTKEIKRIYIGKSKFDAIDKNNLRFINSLKVPEINAREYLFIKILEIFNYNSIDVKIVMNIAEVKHFLDEAKNNLVEKLIVDIRTIFINKQSDMATLFSIIKDWYESLQESTRNHLYSAGEERVLEILKSMNNDEKFFVEKLAKGITGLRIEDWDDNTISSFLEGIKAFKQKIEEKDRNFVTNSHSNDSELYKIVFVDKDRNETVKTFNKTRYSSRAKLLYNDLAATVEEHGEAITENEKRQVLMDILDKLCR
jgi:hypothetical protein